MNIPLKVALLIDFIGAVFFFFMMVLAVNAGHLVAAIGCIAAILAFAVSAYIQHCRSIGYETGSLIFVVLGLAIIGATLLAVSASAWVAA